MEVMARAVTGRGASGESISAWTGGRQVRFQFISPRSFDASACSALTLFLGPEH